MADFRMKLFTLAGMATVFAGMAFGQATSCVASANAVYVRAESNDDQVADTTITCTGTSGIATTQNVSLTVYLSPSVNITSVNVASGASEATAGISSGTSFLASVQGVVSGNSVTFSNIPLTAYTSGPLVLTITNIKIAASTVATTSGVPTAINESIFLSGTGVIPAAISTTSAVAYVTNGLTAAKASGATSNPLCSAVNTFGGNPVAASVPNFTVSFAEAFPNAFKIQGGTGNTTLGSEFTNHTETGYYVSTGTGNVATSGTRISVTFNNLPSNVTVYVPLAVPASTSGGGVLTLTASATGAISPVAGSTANGAPGSTASNAAGDGSAAALTVTGGSATAIYEVTIVSTSPATFAVPVYLQSTAGAVAAPTTAITATVSFAPIGATSNVPNFVSGSSTTTVNGSTYSACSTTLLFPYVTNQSGFETGIAISNTGADLLGTHNGSPVSSVTGQSGTCLLTFFGSATAAAYTTPTSVAPGTTWTSTLSSAAGVSGFGGYVIAQCNFQYAHGYAFVEDGLGTTSGVAEGYLALIMTPTSTAARTPASSTAPESLNN